MTDSDSTRAAIERRAYEISQSPEAGTPEENWVRAEAEVAAAAGRPKPRRPRAPRQPKQPTGS